MRNPIFFYFDNLNINFQKCEEMSLKMLIRFSTDKFNTLKLKLKPVSMYFVIRLNYCKWNNSSIHQKCKQVI